MVSQQVGQANVNGTKLRAFPFPLPPETEQYEIIRRSADAADSVTHSKGAVTGLLEQARALRQSILKRAFEGRLVPQDLDDEPASALLDRMPKPKPTKSISLRAGDSAGGRSNKPARRPS